MRCVADICETRDYASSLGNSASTKCDTFRSLTGGIVCALRRVVNLELIQNNEVSTVEMKEAVLSVGGARSDGLVLQGLPPGLLSLRLEHEQLTVFAQRPLRIGPTVIPARVPRLLLEGEYICLPNRMQLGRKLNAQRRTSRQLAETAMVAQELLSGALSPETTRAATITCVTGLDRGRVFPLAFDDNVVGRGTGASVRIRDRSVSRSQVRLLRRGAHFIVRPISAATNSVYLNGHPLLQDTRLNGGDVLEMGQTVLRYDESEGGPDASAARTVMQEMAPSEVPVVASTTEPVHEMASELPPEIDVSDFRAFPPETVAVGLAATLMLFGLLTACLTTF